MDIIAQQILYLSVKAGEFARNEISFFPRGNLRTSVKVIRFVIESQNWKPKLQLEIYAEILSKELWWERMNTCKDFENILIEFETCSV